MGIPIKFLESFLNNNFGYETYLSQPKNYYRDRQVPERSKRTVKTARLSNDIKEWVTKILSRY